MRGGTIVDLGPHQLKAVRELDNGKILKGGVGTGKSRTAIAFYYKLTGGSFPINGVGEFGAFADARDLYIITTAKKRDSLEWRSELAWFLIGEEDRSRNHGYVATVIDSWNNIGNYTDVTGAVFIFDEQRLVGSGAWVKAFYKIAASNQWIILSATPGDTWADYIPCFVANGYYKNRTQFMDHHAVWSRYSKFPKVESWYNTDRLERLRERVLVEMPYERLTIRISKNIICPYDPVKLKKITEERWDIYNDSPIENVSALFYAMRKVVNSDPSRVEELRKVYDKHRKVIVFYNFTYELDILREWARDQEIPFTEWNGQKHEEILDSDNWLYLVQYTAGAEGWNCITTDAIFFYSLTYSWRAFEQSHGRIDRMNTPFKELYYYVARSMAPIDQSIWKALKTKKNFNETKTALQWETPFLMELPKAA